MLFQILVPFFFYSLTSSIKVWNKSNNKKWIENMHQVLTLAT